MGIIARFTDGLANLASGLGTSADKRTGSFYHRCTITPDQIDAAYRTSWLVRKIVDVPALDMTRERRDWQAEQADIEKLEGEEKRLKLWAKVRQALILGRLGGGAIILGVGNEDPALPINARSLKAGALRYMHVVSRWRLSIGQIVMDPKSDLFGQPEYFSLGSQNGAVRIHPSRVVVFRGLHVPELGITMSEEQFWGDSVIQSINDAVKNADTATAGFASLIHEAKVDTVSIPGLIDLVATADGEKLLQKRVDIANTFKSIWNTRILDGGSGDGNDGETWDTRQINWAGMPDVMNAFMGFVAGAADIPATRLLGRSPQGMNATGDGDLTNYYDRIQAQQDSDLRPQLEQIDQVLIPSAGVAMGEQTKTWFEFPPLTTPTEAEEATTFNTSMDAITKLQSTGTVPDLAMSKAVQNFMVERGYLPGLEGALAEIPEAERFPEPPDDEEDPSSLTQKGGDPSTGAKGGSPKGKVPFGDHNPNRHPAGTRRGGQFAPKGSGSFGADLRPGPITNAGAIKSLTGLDASHLQRGARASDLNHASKFSKKGRRPPSQAVLRSYAKHAATAHSMRLQGQRGHGSGLRLRSEIKIGKRSYTLIERVGERSRSLSFVTMWENE
jgi:phage-related protein (TIGR01555 family)